MSGYITVKFRKQAHKLLFFFLKPLDGLFFWDCFSKFILGFQEYFCKLESGAWRLSQLGIFSMFYDILYYFLSHALKNTANQRPRKPLRILRYPTCSIQWVVFQRVVFHLAFPPLLASDYRNGAKTVCVPFRNGAKVFDLDSSVIASA